MANAFAHKPLENWNLRWNAGRRAGAITDGAGFWDFDTTNGVWSRGDSDAGTNAQSWATLGFNGFTTYPSPTFGGGTAGAAGNITVDAAGVNIAILFAAAGNGASSYTFAGGAIRFASSFYGYGSIEASDTSATGTVFNTPLVCTLSGGLRKNGTGRIKTTSTASGCLPEKIAINAGEWIFAGGAWFVAKVVNPNTAVITIGGGASAAKATVSTSHAIGGSNSVSRQPGVTVKTNGELALSAEQYFRTITLEGGSITGTGELRTGPSSSVVCAAGMTGTIASKLNQVNAAPFAIDGVLTISGVVMGTNALTKNGAGTLTLSGNNTYTGGTAINAGIARAGHINAFGTGTITLAAGATLDKAGFALANTIVNNGGTILP